MSGSEARIRNYRIGARASAEEKQHFTDLRTRLGFQSEGDLIRFVFLGTMPFKRPKVQRQYLHNATFTVRITVNEDGSLTREVGER